MQVEINSDFAPSMAEQGILGESTISIDEKERPTFVCMTPAINEDYWAFRVRVSKRQSIVVFPKFFTFGIGFAKERSDWNTNLPYQCDAEEIYNHIKCNKGSKKITKETCIKAIKLLQEAIIEYKNRVNKGD